MEGYLSHLRRVYLVDDHDIVRRGVRDLLVPARDLQVVGDSGSAREAVPEILRLGPDVMLLDLHLQDGTGIEICRAVRSENPAIAGLLLTAAGDDEALAAAVLAGAAGYVIKVSRSSNIMNTVRRLQPGNTLMDPDSIERASRLLESITESLTPSATDTERRILDLLIEGRTDSQITQALAASEADSARKIADLVARLTQALLAA
ncbi:response regulator transcription factor [Nocardioides sp. L-11A]|uniref:response regulator n=1 Tax=Nocardioides sp. L-11A TaxID=3043848 RepID=UPI002499E973|nr:response regulator transcription factor [Nocardioides sp. L-11A]